MDNLLSIVLSLLPDLILIVVGGVISKRMTPDIWAGIDRLNFLVLFPALLFISASARPIAIAEIASVGVGVWAIIGIGFGFGLLLRPWGPASFLDFAGTWQTAWRFNTAIAFVAASTMPAAVSGLLPVAIGLAVPVANVLAVGALSRGRGGWKSRLIAIATNPFLLASLAGIFIGLSGIALPKVPVQALSRLSEAAVPMALLSIGAAMDWKAVFRLDRFYGGLNAIKLLVLPFAVWIAGPHLTDDTALVALLIVFAALPTASAAHILAGAFGADRRAPSILIAQSTLLSCVTLPLWIAVALRL